MQLRLLRPLRMGPHPLRPSSGGRLCGWSSFRFYPPSLKSRFRKAFDGDHSVSDTTQKRIKMKQEKEPFIPRFPLPKQIQMRIIKKVIRFGLRITTVKQKEWREV